MEIFGIKLTTGEDLLAETGKNNAGQFVFINPLQMRMMPPQIAGGAPVVGFMPYPAFAKQESKQSIVIDPLHVVHLYTPDEQLVNQYNSVFGAGIMVPATKQIITG